MIPTKYVVTGKLKDGTQVEVIVTDFDIFVKAPIDADLFYVTPDGGQSYCPKSEIEFLGAEPIP